MISKPILDINAEEKEKATFECEVSRTNVDVKWFKVRNSSGVVKRNVCRHPKGFYTMSQMIIKNLKKKLFCGSKTIAVNRLKLFWAANN